MNQEQKITSAGNEEMLESLSENSEGVTNDVEAKPDVEEQYLGGDYSSDIMKKMRADPTAIGKMFKEGKFPYTDRISKSAYSQEKAKLQIELFKVQN